MAEHKLNGTDVLLFMSRDNITFNTVICTTSATFSGTTNIIDAKTKCGPDKLPGTQDFTLTAEGQVMEDPAGATISTDELDDYLKTKQTIYWRLGKATPAIGDETHSGTGFVAKLERVYAQDTPATFSLEIGIYGVPSKSTATS